MCNMSTFLSMFDPGVTRGRALMPHRCKYCPRFFHKFQQLKRHVDIHRGVYKKHQGLNGRREIGGSRENYLNKVRKLDGLCFALGQNSLPDSRPKYYQKSAIETGDNRVFKQFNCHDAKFGNHDPKLGNHDAKFDNQSGFTNDIHPRSPKGDNSLPLSDQKLKPFAIDRIGDIIKIKQEIMDDSETEIDYKSLGSNMQYYQDSSLKDQSIGDHKLKPIPKDKIGDIIKIKQEVIDDSETEFDQSSLDNDNDMQFYQGSSLKDQSFGTDFDQYQQHPSNYDQWLDLIDPSQYYFSSATPYRCIYCSKSFSKSSNRLIHQRAHLKDPFPWVCKECSKKFRSRVALEVHTRMHTGEKPYKCPFCESHFSTKGYLNVHVRYHTGEMPYQCEFCQKSFRESCKLKVHTRTHTLEKPYKCRFCDNTFSQRGNARKHERIHTGEKPYKCCHCDKEYTNFRNFHRHELKHTQVDPYRCELCDLSFKFLRSLKTHEKLHTGGGVFVCAQCNGAYSSPSNLKKHRKDVHWSRNQTD